jgi:hypothetical protein
MIITLKRGDTRTAVKATLITGDGTPCDLTDLTVRAVMAALRGRTILARGVDIVDAAEGRVLLVFEPPETDAAGTYWLEFEVEHKDGRKETYPNSGYITVEILPDLEG